MEVLVLKIGISGNTNCDNLVGFPKSGHIYTEQFLKNSLSFISKLRHYTEYVAKL